MPDTPADDGKPRRKKSGSETRKRSLHPFPLRLSPEERAQIEVAAERAGLTLGSYIRSRVLERPTTRPRRRASVDLEVMAKVLAQLMRVGGLLHQLVKHLNFRGIVYPDEARAALRSFDSMVAVHLDAMERVR